MKVRLGQLNGFRHRRVMGLAAHRALEFIGRIAGLSRPVSAEHPASDLEYTPGRADHGWLKRGHVPVATLIAVKPELISLVGRHVVVITDELDERHDE